MATLRRGPRHHKVLVASFLPLLKMPLREELQRYEAAWLSKLHYHTKNLALLIREFDGLDNSYTSLLIEDVIRNNAVEKGDQRQSTLIAHSSRRRNRTPLKASNVRSEMHCIDYEAQFYAELRAYHDAKYAWSKCAFTIVPIA
ncbi:hypothetical protein BOTBODRAFT_379100 [Botryobasidium botryosum FD-172 SS1]|uniref:Uncharacterized protein n=1 Tax=Botryobasidium botryosum (strain FD-172 SS1) TaxID=930990 RepID=A0A067N6V5_BOTB1|nr:hypothetical protein BOTBODRAFT_379100 [Botryobasidium botryosum FD-172 SS1]